MNEEQKNIAAVVNWANIAWRELTSGVIFKNRNPWATITDFRYYLMQNSDWVQVFGRYLHMLSDRSQLEDLAERFAELVDDGPIPSFRAIEELIPKAAQSYSFSTLGKNVKDGLVEAGEFTGKIVVGGALTYAAFAAAGLILISLLSGKGKS